MQRSTCSAARPELAERRSDSWPELDQQSAHGIAALTRRLAGVGDGCNSSVDVLLCTVH
jgi:hypothetical protein